MSDPITYVLLVRHGENDWVNSHRLAGRSPGVHLNDNGREQTERLRRALSEQPIAAIYSSPLERCIETAQPVAAALGLTVIPEPGLLEVNYGQWQGGDLKELAKSPEWELVQHLPGSFRFPDGETLYEVQGRAVETIERLRIAHPNQTVAIFSHGDVIRDACSLSGNADRPVPARGDQHRIGQRHRLFRPGRQCCLRTTWRISQARS